MKIYIVGQKWLGAEAFLLCRRFGHVVSGVCAPALAGADPNAKDRLRALAGREGVPWTEAGRLTPADVPPGTDLILAAHAHDFISGEIRRRARLGGIGYHPSLLPLHRGRDAILWALRMNERVTGGTVYWLEDGADTGPVAAQEWCFIRPGDTPESLWRRELGPMGLRLLERLLADLSLGRVTAEPQDEALATWEPAYNPRPFKLARPSGA